MNIDALIDRPIGNWTLTGIQAVASARIAESQRLEFKADFEQGSQEKWRVRRDQISSRSRDALADELVAFANSFGGVLLLGIREERQEDGRRVSAGLGDPVPDVVGCADRLEAGLRDIIDPPLPLLEIHAVQADEEGGGYLVIKVPPSLSAPHGVGRPPKAFVRRGASAEPMTMRDLQHVFWEARTAIDRVDRVFDSRRSHFVSEVMRLETVPPKSPNIFYRFTIVPSRAYEIPRLPAVLKGPQRFHFREVPFLSSQPTILAPENPRWSPIARGMTATRKHETPEGRLQELTIWTDGTLELRGRFVKDNIPEVHYPGWYAIAAVWLLYNAKRLRRHLGRTDIPLLVEGALVAGVFSGPVVFKARSDDWDSQVSEAPTVMAHTDRLQLGRDSEFDEIVELLAEQIG